MRLLILGGTAWLSGLVASTAVQRGHDVTCLARGGSVAPALGVRFVRADRADDDAYAAVPGEWDAVVDVTRQPGQARSAARALAGRSGFLVLVSSSSVYADDATAGADETAPLLPPLTADVMASMADYGPAKVACEQAAVAGFGADRTLIVRAGLIGGPGDWSGRTGYWPWRFAHPGSTDGAVVVPAAPGLSTQVIDVRDLAGWLVDCCERAVPGVCNAAGDPVSLEEHLAVARRVAGHRGSVLAADQWWLAAHGVQPWMGPCSMPLWLPMPEYAGHGARSVAVARGLGLTSRPLAATLADTLAWELQRRGVDPQLGWASGLTDAEASELVERLGVGGRSQGVDLC